MLEDSVLWKCRYDLGIVMPSVFFYLGEYSAGPGEIVWEKEFGVYFLMV